MDKLMIDPEINLRLMNIALKTRLTKSEVVEALLNYHFDDNDIINRLKPPTVSVTDMADLTTKRLLR